MDHFTFVDTLDVSNYLRTTVQPNGSFVVNFLQPVKVGDVVCVYTEITKIGRTSMTVGVEAYVLRRNQGERVRVTAAEFVLVAVDDHGKPRALPPD